MSGRSWGHREEAIRPVPNLQRCGGGGNLGSRPSAATERADLRGRLHRVGAVRGLRRCGGNLLPHGGEPMIACRNGHTGGRYPSGICKECQKERDARWKAKNPEKPKEKERARYLANREALLAKNKDYKRRTGRNTRWQRAQKMRAPASAVAQRHCDVCGYVAPPQTRNLHLDHDHATGLFRGVLCGGCNTSLGALNENPERILALAEYARRRCRG